MIFLVIQYHLKIIPDITTTIESEHYKQQSGGSVLTGWLATFCVFDNDGKYNDDEYIESFAGGEKKEDFPWPRVKAQSIANGNFTTTTESDKVVFSIALMSTMKKYFKFVFKSFCGLSEVTLLGEINDWINLKERVEKLIQFDNKDGEIKKWLVYLLPVIDKFIESAYGNSDTTWWNQIVNFKQQSGGSILTGWLATFCVFDNDGKYNDGKYNDNKYIESYGGKKKEDFPWPRVIADKIANGFVSCPVLLKDIEKEYNSTIYSGHFGSKLLDSNSKLIPSLDWFIVAKVL
ncbi:hypothetical protein ACTFIZ_011884 [Dictyostelium cf. discoideum]